MKNIHVLPTKKPSRLHLGNSGLVLCDLNFGKNTINGQNIYITSDEKIKEGDYIISLVDDESFGMVWKCDEYQIKNMIDFDLEFKKIILTTDQDLIKDGVQAINNEFLEWFVKNPSCESVEVEKLDTFKKTNEIYVDEITRGNYYEVNKQYKIIIPQEELKQIKCYCGHTITCDCEPKQETLEEHNYLQGFINQFEEGGEHQEISNDDWTVSQFLKWLKLNNFKIVKNG